MMKHLLGKLAVNGAGEIGKIEEYRAGCFYGVGVKGGQWQSFAPLILSTRMQGVLEHLA